MAWQPEAQGGPSSRDRPDVRPTGMSIEPAEPQSPARRTIVVADAGGFTRSMIAPIAGHMPAA
jgi:hypothetical protein